MASASNYTQRQTSFPNKETIKMVKLLSRRSDFRGFLAILQDVVAIGLIIYANILFDNIWLYLCSIWLIGAFQFAMGECLVHEACHYNLFKRRYLNNLSEIFICLPFFQTMSSYRREHKFHHTHLLQDKDTLKEEYKSYGLNSDTKNMFYIWFIKPIIGYSVVMLANGGQAKADKKDLIRVLALWAMVLPACYYAKILDYLVMYWIVPVVFCKGAFLYWSEIADHYATRSGFRTRTGFLANLLFHNNGYHHVHHRYPSITQFNYKRAYDMVSREGDDISSSFIDTYQQISLGKTDKQSTSPAHYTLTAEA